MKDSGIDVNSVYKWKTATVITNYYCWCAPFHCFSYGQNGSVYSMELSIVDYLKRESAVQRALKKKQKLQPQGCMPLHNKEAAVYIHICI